jgi:hypothetical protein
MGDTQSSITRDACKRSHLIRARAHKNTHTHTNTQVADGAVRMRKLRRQIEKEETIRVICAKLHVAAAELIREYMPAWRRKHEHITHTHYIYFLRRYRSLLLERRQQLLAEIAELSPTLRQVRKISDRRRYEEYKHEVFTGEEHALDARQSVVDARLAAVEGEMARLQAVVRDKDAAIQAQELALSKLSGQLEVETLRMATVWNQVCISACVRVHVGA